MTYNRLYSELSLHDNIYLTKEVIEDDFLCDCYLIWERIKKPKLDNKDLDDNDSKRRKKRTVNQNSKIPSVVFTRGRK